MMPQSLLTKYPDFWWVNLTSQVVFFKMHWGNFSTRISTNILHHCWLHSREIYVLTDEIHKSTIEIPWNLIFWRVKSEKNTILDGLNRWNPMKHPHFGWVFHRVKPWNPMEKSPSFPREIPSWRLAGHPFARRVDQLLLSPGIHLGTRDPMATSFVASFLQKWWFKHGKHVF